MSTTFCKGLRRVTADKKYSYFSPLATWKEGATLPTLEYEKVTPFFILPPGDRGYGGGKIIPGKIADNNIVPYAEQA